MTVHLRYLYVGEAGPGEHALAPLRAAAPALIDTVDVTPYADVTPAVVLGLAVGLEPWSTGRSLINFHGSASPDAAGAWDADTRARLDELHLRYDPYGTFRFAHPGARPR